jgi:cyclophilin family peptidyl-prolyl cis-trans isomerase
MIREDRASRRAGAARCIDVPAGRTCLKMSHNAPSENLISTALCVIHALEPRSYFAAPVLSGVDDQTIPAGKTIQIPLLADDADGDSLKYTVTSNSSNFSAQFHPTTNRWLKLSTTQGTMVFQLFDDIAPKTVATMVGLANSGFFNGLTFHRIATTKRDGTGDPFIAQSGDPLGTGAGGPGFQFNDEFDANTLFDGDGQLAMANNGKDTNGSQFFITKGAHRFLDFNHTIWGQLVRGFGTLTKLFGVPRAAQSPSDDEVSRPTVKQLIKSATIVTDTTDAVLSIKAKAIGSGKITVKVDDGHGGTSTQVFNVTGKADTANDPPILGAVPDRVIGKNKTMNLQLSATDPEGDKVEYAVQLLDNTAGTVSADENGYVTYKPRKNLTGPVTLFIGVRAPGASTRGSTDNPYDIQQIRIGVGDVAASGSGRSAQLVAGVKSKLTVARFTDSDPASLASNWNAAVAKDAQGNVIAGINWGDDAFSDGAIVKNSDGSFSVTGSHGYDAPGEYPIHAVVEGNLGARLIFDATAIVNEVGSIANGVLTINGTSNSDVIGVSSKLGMFNVNVNGVIKKFSPAGVERIELFAGDGDDSVSIGGGVPRAYIDAGAGNDAIFGGNGNDTLTGGAGKNTLHGGPGNDRINGSGGHDFIFGEDGDDRLYGNGGDDVLDGGGGVDRLFAGDGNDQLIGGGSNDKLYGEAGDDSLIGGKGSDLLDGGAGTDKSDGDGTDALTSIEEAL